MLCMKIFHRSTRMYDNNNNNTVRQSSIFVVLRSSPTPLRMMRNGRHRPRGTATQDSHADDNHYDIIK
jgi:hypothetical protein